MSSFTQPLSAKFKEFLQFLKSTDFSKAILIGIAVTLPILLGLQLGHLEIGLALCFGAFWSSPSDVSGNFRHKVIGILFSAALVMLVSFIGGYLKVDTEILIPILGVLTFAIAYISVYGFRASLISFSGLLALVLSFAHDPKGLEVYQYALLIGLGGLWYLLLTFIWHKINPKGQTEELLSETYVLTGKLLQTRGNMIGSEDNLEKLQSQWHKLQDQLIENHETLRDILILSRKSSGKSVYHSKRLLVFVQLVEMLETAIANPVNFTKMQALFKAYPEFMKSFQNLIFEMSDQLKMLAEAGRDKKKFPKNTKLSLCFENLSLEITAVKENPKTENVEGFLMLQNFYEYVEKQFEKLKTIKRLLGDSDASDLNYLDWETSKRFVVPQDYDPKILIRNLSLKSNIFKHSLRLAVTVMIGYAVGTIFDFQNPYWILLTIIVILRPSYGLTKTRSKDRTIGTLIGGAIAFVIVSVVQNPYLFGTLGVISLVIAFSMVQKNYKTSATFITLSVIFIYAIIRPDVLTVIQYRVLDTLIGALLAFLATLWLWPAWGFYEIKDSIRSSIEANKDFLFQITEYYKDKGKVPTVYKVSRKQAFLETSNLSSAFQRMVQEPKSKQKNLDAIYEMVTLNHTFLSSLASMSTYVQNHGTTEASEKFNRVVQRININLGKVLDSLDGREIKKKFVINDEPVLFEENITSDLTENQDINKVLSSESQRNLQEAHLIWEHLNWLVSMSDNMLKLTSKIKFD
ncbi:Uncharacterized membrane protein YccC [Flavobacteriaceae bacterium MAR_2010_188]|nr:Uncharacterized membrane protein YccC [Flavobacteriaceae bacterium MAR_2010_188]